MPIRLIHHLDSMVATVTSLCAALATWLMLATSTPADYDELKLLLLPLIGAMVVSGGMIMLNPTPETRRIVIGRAAIALFLASVAPQFISILFPAWSNLLSHAIILFGSGGVLSSVFYALSKPFAEGLYQRSRMLADLTLDQAERAAHLDRKETVKEAVKEVAIEEKNTAKETIKEAVKETIEEIR